MGEVFAGRYELIDPIGEGGAGSVWRAWDGRQNRIVAAKVLKQADAVGLLRFVREQAVRVAHPHVVVPLGWAGEDDRVLFTMPLLRGGSAATLVGDYGALPPLLVAELLRQLADALAAVHASGFVHRDLKPANVLLDATGPGRPHAYLSDFGIALEIAGPRWTALGYVPGTPGYVAPEVAAGEASTAASDVYGLGQLALTLLSGAGPEVRPDAAVAGVGPVWTLVREMTRVDPGERPSLDEVRRRLDAPELAWRPDAIGDLEVFDQLPELPSGWAPRTPVDPAVATAGVPLGAEPDGPRPQPADVVETVPDAPHPRRAVAPAPEPDRAKALAAPESADASGAEQASRRAGRESRATSPAGQTSEEPPGSSVAPGPQQGQRRRDVIAAATVLALLVAGVLMIWQPWAGAPGGTASTPPAGGGASLAPSVAPSSTTPGPGTSTTTTAGPSSTGTTTTAGPSSTGTTSGTTTTASTSSTSTTTSSTTSPPTTASTSATIKIGTVVISPGQPCASDQVTTRETTTGGQNVVCTRQADGSYAWVAS